MSLTAMDLVAEAKQQITEIDIEQTKAKMAACLVLDVREPAEFSAGHLPGAINIPRGVVEFKITAHPDFQSKQNDDIIVYCQGGNRSALATLNLNRIGYSKAISMLGGFAAWEASGNPIVK
ncbi:MAG: rhodanese [Methylobacter sp.]|nr:MAG: rhodanese [Methylobacter sp.]PPD03035.1 MAG: rhodanese [Methylobacter sp.]PPD21609.1 MAG: rhodanese [Methylobacter sp.]PPD37150.1 MAG: rhodanese [Methylomonas sp.]